MPLSKLKNIRIDFSLFDENSKPKAKLPIYIQYYEVAKNEWISIYVATIEKGVLSIEETTKSRVKALMSFFKILKDNQIPELRIIAQKNLYNLEKFQVLTSMYAFYFDEENSLLHFDFGTAYLLNEELLKQQKGFKDFIVVTSPYSFANQKENKKEIQRLGNALKKCIANQKRLDESLAESKNQLKEKEGQYTDVSNKFKDVIKQNKKLSNEYSILQENFGSLKKEASDCKSAKEKINADFIKEQKENEKLNNKIIDLNKKIKSIDSSLNEAKKEVKRLTPFENKYQILQKEFDILDENYSDSMKELKQCSERYKTLQDSYDLLLIEKQDYIEKLAICNSEKKQSEEERIESNEKVINLEADFSKAKQEITQKRDKINQLNSKIEELSKDVEFDMRPMPVSGVYANIVNEIQLAETLNKSNFKLANIQLKLKTLVNRDKEGMNLQFLNHGTAKEVNGNSISELILDIESAPREIIESGNLPSLIGFTETAVRRILSNLGLRFNPVYQKNMNVPSGESFKQSPALNSDIQNNQVITVIFSKNE